MGSVNCTTICRSVAAVTLNRPKRRNALNTAVMTALVDSIQSIAPREGCSVVLLQGTGPAFCAGFDLADAVAQPGLMSCYIKQLGAITRAVRRLPQVVVAAVQGAALAGGCAIVSACDFVIAAPDAQFGYPVHCIGVSPAVTIPTLRHTVGDGRCRETLMGGQIIDGCEAHRIGLVSHLAQSSGSLESEADALCKLLASKGPIALRTTKQWINELDGSMDDAPFNAAVWASALNAGEPEATRLLQEFWARRNNAR